VREIDQKTKSLNRDTEDARSELDQEQQKIMGELFSRIQVVLDKYAKDNGYTLTWTSARRKLRLMFASNTIDITRRSSSFTTRTRRQPLRRRQQRRGRLFPSRRSRLPNLRRRRSNKGVRVKSASVIFADRGLALALPALAENPSKVGVINLQSAIVSTKDGRRPPMTFRRGSIPRRRIWTNARPISRSFRIS